MNMKPEITIDLETNEDKAMKNKKKYLIAVLAAGAICAVVVAGIFYQRPDLLQLLAWGENSQIEKQAKLESQIEMLQADIKQIKQNNQQYKNRIEELTKLLQSMQQQQNQTPPSPSVVFNNRQAAALALLNLQTAIEAGQKFTSQLEMAKFFLPISQLNKLQKFASGGVKNIEMLKLELKKINLSIEPQKNILNHLTSYIHVSYVKNENKMLEIQSQLQQGQLENALQLVNEINPKPAVLQNWQQQLEQKIAVEKIISNIITIFTKQQESDAG